MLEIGIESNHFSNKTGHQCFRLKLIQIQISDAEVVPVPNIFVNCVQATKKGLFSYQIIRKM